jgi:hypothetical protein
MSRTSSFIRIFILMTVGLLTVPVSSFTVEIHSKHFFYGCPVGARATNDLIIREDYALSSNDETKFADWVGYQLEAAIVEGNAKAKPRAFLSGSRRR